MKDVKEQIDYMESVESKNQTSFSDRGAVDEITNSETNASYLSKQTKDEENQDGMRRTLKSRHIQMIALGNSIG
jgi:amino acid permease